MSESMPGLHPPSLADDSGTEYLDGISAEDRRAGGRVYTPPALAAFVLEQSGFCPSSVDTNSTLLDPACGAGIFLELAVRQSAQAFTAKGHDLRSRSGRAAFVDFIQRTVFGIDVDPVACRMARQTLATAVANETAAPVALDALDANILEADFLLSPSVDALGRLNQHSGFSVVVGNPPYVGTHNLTADYKTDLRTRFSSAFGRLDLYTVFMERSLDVLRPGGRMALITPDNYLRSRSGAPIRELLAQNTVRRLALFRSNKVFPDAATIPCVTVVERTPVRDTRESFEIVECKRPSPDGTVPVARRRELPRRRLGAHAWHLLSGDIDLLARRIRGDRQNLADLVERISAGLATGRDGVFVRPERETVNLDAQFLRPAIRGRDVGALHLADPGLRVILPYEADAHGIMRLASIDSHRATSDYLGSHRAVLEERHCVRRWGKAWYDLHDPVGTDLARRAKILVPDLANGSRFAFDNGHFFPLHSAYYILPGDADPIYLAGILNSQPLEFIIRLTAPRAKDGFVRYRRQVLADLPIPDPSTGDATGIVAAVESGDIESINDRAYDLFGLGSRERSAVETYLFECESVHDR